MCGRDRFGQFLRHGWGTVGKEHKYSCHKDADLQMMMDDLCLIWVGGE